MRATYGRTLAVAISLVLTWSGAAWAAPAPLATQPDGELRFPTFGVAFTPPGGWQVAPPVAPHQIARLVKLAPGGETLAGMLSIEFYRNRELSLSQWSERLLQRKRGQLDPTPLALTDVAAQRFRFPNVAAQGGMHGGFCALRQNVVYAVTASGPAGSNLDTELEALRASWRWVLVESPADHLALLEQPVTLFQGAVSVRVPVVARPDDRKKTDDESTFFIANPTLDRDLAHIIFYTGANPQRLSLAAFAGDFDKRMAMQTSTTGMKLSGPLTWNTLTGVKLPHLASQFVTMTDSTFSGPQASKRVRYVLFAPAADRVLLCHLIIDSYAEKDLAKYDAMAVQMMQSVTFTAAK